MTEGLVMGKNLPETSKQTQPIFFFFLTFFKCQVVKSRWPLLCFSMYDVWSDTVLCNALLWSVVKEPRRGCSGLREYGQHIETQDLWYGNSILCLGYLCWWLEQSVQETLPGWVKIYLHSNSAFTALKKHPFLLQEKGWHRNLDPGVWGLLWGQNFKTQPYAGVTQKNHGLQKILPPPAQGQKRQL